MELEVLVEQYKNINDKLDKISNKVENLGTETVIQRMDIDQLKAEIVFLKTKQDGISKDIEELRTKPVKEKAERWSTVMNVILKGIAGLFVTAMLAYIGLKV